MKGYVVVGMNWGGDGGGSRAGDLGGWVGRRWRGSGGKVSISKAVLATVLEFGLDMSLGAFAIG